MKFVLGVNMKVDFRHALVLTRRIDILPIFKFTKVLRRINIPYCLSFLFSFNFRSRVLLFLYLLSELCVFFATVKCFSYFYLDELYMSYMPCYCRLNVIIATRNHNSNVRCRATSERLIVVDIFGNHNQSRVDNDL